MRYRERLRVPVSWWAVGLFFAVSFATAVGFALGPVVSLVGGALVALALVLVLWWYGSVLVGVDSEALHAGDAVLEWQWAGAVRVLDAAATRERLGPAADPHALLVTRGYIPAAVEVEIADEADPHPYWLISTRHPRELANAIEAELSLRMQR